MYQANAEQLNLQKPRANSTTTRTHGDIKRFFITAGKVLKLVEIIRLNAVVVSSYHHPHETYTDKCWLASRLHTVFMDPSDR